MNTAIIGLGSNIEPQNNINRAKALIAGKFRVLKESKFILTKPVGLIDQPDFINGAILVQTEDGMDQFRSRLKLIEKEIGRPQNSLKNSEPRVIDIDLLAWDDRVIDQDFYERDFIRNFVLELSPAVRY